jgi:hypothetical protein
MCSQKAPHSTFTTLAQGKLMLDRLKPIDPSGEHFRVSDGLYFYFQLNISCNIDTSDK